GAQLALTVVLVVVGLLARGRDCSLLPSRTGQRQRRWAAYVTPRATRREVSRCRRPSITDSHIGAYALYGRDRMPIPCPAEGDAGIRQSPRTHRSHTAQSEGRGKEGRCRDGRVWSL